jgi:hypothetical protein
MMILVSGEPDKKKQKRDTDWGKTFDNAAKVGQLGLSAYQIIKSEQELKKMGKDPRIEVSPEVKSLYDRLARESSYGMSSGAESSLRGQADDNLRNIYRAIEESGASKGSQLANKLAATLKSTQSSGRSIAEMNEQIKMQKLGMMPSVAGMIQDTDTRSTLAELEARRLKMQALGQMQQSGVYNAHDLYKTNRLLSERDKRLAYQNQGIDSNQFLAQVYGQ